jgi:hypothetical protein
MSEDFENVWLDIQKRLMSGTLVRFWNPEKGYSGGSFPIDDVDAAGVIVRHGQTGSARRVSKRNFQHLFAFRQANNHGFIASAELGKPSEDSSYILSILQWRDETQCLPAPAQRIPFVPIPPQSEAVLATGLAGNAHYGKQVLLEATESRAVLLGPSIEIDFGTGPPARIDATVGDIAVVIEAGVSRQVRGAVLDLICHSYPKKLLMLLPDHMISRGITAEQCRNILRRFCPEGSFRVFVLKGSGSSPQLTQDAAIMAGVLADLWSG